MASWTVTKMAGTSFEHKITVEYTTSTSSGVFTFKLTKVSWKMTATTGSIQSVTVEDIKVGFDSTQLCSTGYETIDREGGWHTYSITKTVNQTTSAQTKQLTLQVGGNPSDATNITVPALPSYSVTYNANGGTGTTASQTKIHGQNLTLRANGFTKTNYAFKCWNTNTSDPAASRYSAGATYTGNAALALYAIWNPIISFNANGGSGAPSNQTKTFNSQLSLTGLATPTRTGYTFSKWNTAANGSGTSYASNGTIAASMNTAVTLYAQWTANTYTISFATSKGSGVPSSISKTYGQSVTLPIDRPVRIGHTFLGWALSSSAETAQWLPGANFSEAIAANTILHAVWRDDYESPSITTLRAYRCGFELTADTEIIEGKVYYTHSYSYALTEDETVDPSKTYYVYDSQEDEYVEVAEPVDADIATYYERSDVYTSVSEPDVSEISTYYEMVDDDEAGYARIEATWSIDTSVDEGVTNTATMTGTITPEGQQAQSIAFESGYQGVSGTATAIVSGLDVDTQYNVTVTVTDIKGASKATSRTVLLLRAFYIMDFGAQGNAVGIGRAAPDSGLEVGYHATFDDDVNLLGALKMNSVNIFNLIYPVGSIYMSVNSTSPATLFGGTWERITGKFLLSATDNGSSGASQAAGNTGGAATVTLTSAQSGVPAHLHSIPAHGHAHTIKATTPKFTHSITQPIFKYTAPASHQHNLSSAGGAKITPQSSGSATLILHDDGGGGPTVAASAYTWHKWWSCNSMNNASERPTSTTGLAGKTDSATGAGSANATQASQTRNVGVGDHAATACTMSGGVTDKAAFNSNDNTAANASSAHENMPPYLSVYVWKRTA